MVRRSDFLRAQATSLEDERVETLRKIRDMAVSGDDPDEFLRACVDARMNIVIAGGTSSGKAVSRLAFLVMCAGMPLTLTEIRKYVLNSIDVIVQTGRVGTRRGILETWFPALDGEG